MAGYVKDNMPFGVSYGNPQLTDEQAWDVAAFINSQPHPDKDLSKDWPQKNTKPFDYPFGPYADSFSAWQHKYGPYDPITKAAKKK
jgi:thiosulfate dehydrogenase